MGGGYFPQQGWPWAMPQQQNYQGGGGWPGMYGGYGGQQQYMPPPQPQMQYHPTAGPQNTGWNGGQGGTGYGGAPANSGDGGGMYGQIGDPNFQVGSLASHAMGGDHLRTRTYNPADLTASGFAGIPQAPGQYQPQTQMQTNPAAQQGPSHRARLNQQITNLGEQYKGAGTQDQAGILQRQQGLQGRVDRLKSQAQAARQGNGAPAPGAPAQAQAPAPGVTAPAANNGSAAANGGFDWNAYNASHGNIAGVQQGNTDQFGNVISNGAYNQRTQDWRQNQTLLNPSGFNVAGVGNLVEASGGNHNLYKRNGGDENTLYNFDPNQGWQSQSLAQYQSTPDRQYYNPYSSTQSAQAAGAQQQKIGRF